MAIRRLPPTLVNRIAAGEVVERPASAVKELVENAHRCRRHAHRGDHCATAAARCIAVVDDGMGMSAGRAGAGGRTPRHLEAAASDDLDQISTLGFRGEALPSIGAVSRLASSPRAPRRR